MGLLIVWASGSACTSTKREVLPPDVLLKRGKKELKNDNFEDAQKTLTQLMEDSPDSKERIIAQLLLAEAYYRQELWEEAKFNFNRFVELYPAHRLAPRAQYQKAMTDFGQIDISIRDQSFTQSAKEEFEKLVRIYPKSPYAQKAQKKIQECVDHLANNQLEIGKFYFRTHSYQSAIRRFKTILEDYPGQKFRDEVIYLLGESYYEEGNKDNARIFFRRLLQEYPRSEFTQDARSRLRQLN